MILNKPYTNTQYAFLAVYCNKNGMIIKDKGDYLESVDPPEKTIEQKKAEVRADRDNKLNGIFWRVERYQTQREADIQTTDDKETYVDILLYLQYLRDYPDNQKVEWWKNFPLSFDEWRKK